MPPPVSDKFFKTVFTLPKLRTAQVESVRGILEEELDAVWANRKPAKEALDNAVTRANAALHPVAEKNKRIK